MTRDASLAYSLEDREDVGQQQQGADATVSGSGCATKGSGLESVWQYSAVEINSEACISNSNNGNVPLDNSQSTGVGKDLGLARGRTRCTAPSIRTLGIIYMHPCCCLSRVRH